VATKKAKTAQKAAPIEKATCPDCGGDVRVVRYAGFGPRGMFWVCDKNCGYVQRTR
jgi:ssDNA-binding Zn-finger/Zn-ribbon topoisomerase 1